MVILIYLPESNDINMVKIFKINIEFKLAYYYKIESINRYKKHCEYFT